MRAPTGWWSLAHLAEGNAVEARRSAEQVPQLLQWELGVAPSHQLRALLSVTMG